MSSVYALAEKGSDNVKQDSSASTDGSSDELCDEPCYVFSFTKSPSLDARPMLRTLSTHNSTSEPVRRIGESTDILLKPGGGIIGMQNFC